jgi:V8-like Glu-specific endopeptidase
MMITFGNRVVTIIAAVGLGACVAVMAPSAMSTAATVSTVARPDSAASRGGPAIAAQGAVVRYWTPARMAGARMATSQSDAGLSGSGSGPGSGPVSTAYPGAPVQPKAKAKPRPKAKAKAPVKAQAQWLTGNTAGDGLRWTHGGAVADAVGKVFFALAGVDYACTGTLVASQHVDIVLTAAHCVSGGVELGGRTEWAADWLFVPGYRGGEKPFGEYTARRFFISPRWTGPAVGREADDVAFVQVGQAALNSGPHVPVPPRGLPVKFAAQSATVAATLAAGLPAGRRLSRAYVFGFPQEPPYSGLYPNFCAGPVRSSGASVATDCSMTAGDSGGPWFGRFSPRTGTGQIVAVTTYKLSGNMRVLYGAVLGPLARALYQRASSWR